MVDERPLYRMRFVGYDANGELKPTAPAFKKNEIRLLPIEYALDFWWEVIDTIPNLVIPEERYTDSVFVEEVFVPPDDKPETKRPPTLSEVLEPVDAVDIAPPPDDEDKFIKAEPGEVIVSHTGDPGHMMTVKVDPDEAAVDEPRFDSEEFASPEVKLVLPVEVTPEDADVIYYDDMTVPSLKLFIKQRGGEVDSKWKKADLVREARELEESLRAASKSS